MTQTKSKSKAYQIKQI